MVTIIDDEWVVDTEALICRNILTEIVVGFERRGETYFGRIKNIPLKLTASLAKMNDGNLLLQKAILDAEEIFNKEMFEMNEKIKTG
jgi:hypothetical protein